MRGILAELARVGSQAGYASLLRRCPDSKALADAKLVHSHIARDPIHSRSILLRNHIILAYGKCGSVGDARATFDSIGDIGKNIFSWSIMIAAYARNGCGREALDLYEAMEADPSAPQSNAFVLSTALGACSDLQDLDRGKRIHARIQARGSDRLERNIVLDTALLEMYASCGCLDRAEEIFCAMRDRDVISWNAMIAAYARSRDHRRAFWFLRIMMLEAAPRPSAATISAILIACCDLAAGREIHSLAASMGVECRPSVVIPLLGMYARFGSSIDEARSVFETIENGRSNLVASNAMIAAYAQRGLVSEALELFEAMAVEPDAYTFATIAGVCADLDLARRLHARITASSIQASTILDTALLAMFARCGCLAEAEAVFESMEDRDAVAWNSMLAALAQQDQTLNRALELYQRMRAVEEPNAITYAILLARCCSSDRDDLDRGRRLLADAAALGLNRDRLVQGAATGMLARCGALDLARQSLAEMEDPDAAAWNAVIAAHAQAGHHPKALEIFQEMELEACSKPDAFTFATALSAAAALGDLAAGKLLHERMALGDRAPDVFAGNALLSMYSKCGSLADAEAVFHGIPARDVVSWNALISAYARHGRYHAALAAYRAMDAEPDDATFVSALAAVAAIPDLAAGVGIHDRVLNRGGRCGAAVESALVSMHAKCGNLAAARRLFAAMHGRRDVVAWNAMVAALAQHGHGWQALELVHEMSLEGVAPNRVTLSGILVSCSHGGLLETGLWYLGWVSAEFGVAMESEHFRCVVDLLARSGRVGEAEAVIRGLETEPQAALWTTLVAACKVHEEVKVAERAAGALDPADASSYVMIANLLSPV